MFKDSNLTVLFLAIMPALLYVYVFFLHLPETLKIDYFKSTKYLLNGFLSTTLVTTVQFLFPNWTTFFPFENSLISLFILAFFQIAFLEEGSKMLFVNYSNMREQKMSLIEIFFYSTLISVGFSISENILYLINYGSDVLLTRAVTATVAHFTFGIMMSYFITLAKIKKENKYWFFALLVPVIAHGLYDFNLFIGSVFETKYDSTYVLLTLIALLYISIIVCKTMINNIKKLNDSMVID